MPEILFFSIILALATSIQSLVGFGFALFAVPLLLLAGLPLVPAVFLVLSTSLVNALIGLRRLRSEIQWRKSVKASIVRALGIIPGYILAVYTAEGSPLKLKAGIGLAIGLGVLAQARKLFLKRGVRGTSADSEPEDFFEPSEKAAPWAFFSSGFLMGWLGMGGPPLVFWLLSGRQCARRSRSFLYSLYVLTIPFQLAVMGFHDPHILVLTVPVLLVAVPICILVSIVALRFGDNLDVNKLQWLSLGLLSLLTLKAWVDWFLEFSSVL